MGAIECHPKHRHMRFARSAGNDDTHAASKSHLVPAADRGSLPLQSFGLVRQGTGAFHHESGKTFYRIC